MCAKLFLVINCILRLKKRLGCQIHKFIRSHIFASFPYVYVKINKTTNDTVAQGKINSEQHITNNKPFKFGRTQDEINK